MILEMNLSYVYVCHVCVCVYVNVLMRVLVCAHNNAGLIESECIILYCYVIHVVLSINTVLHMFNTYCLCLICTLCIQYQLSSGPAQAEQYRQYILLQLIPAIHTLSALILQYH